MHHLLLLELTNLGLIITKLQNYKKNKCTNLLLPCPRPTTTNLKQKIVAHKLDVKQKASVETYCCHNLEVQA